jgi:hypothetical protein
MPEPAQQFLSGLEEEDPTQFEELANKKKWTSVKKNPDKAIKDQNARANNHYWGLINNLPQSTVKAIITDSVLRMDQRSCDTILKAMLREKQEEDFKKQIRNQEQLISRNKTVFKHNKQLRNLESIGVKVRHNS